MIEAVLAAGGCFRLWPRGRSMLPLLREGRDSVLLATPDGAEVGDILLVRTPDGRFLLHRAVALDTTVTLRGDALTETEGPFPLDHILARVVRIFRDERELDPRSPRLGRYARRRRLLAAIRRLLRR